MPQRVARTASGSLINGLSDVVLRCGRGRWLKRCPFHLHRYNCAWPFFLNSKLKRAHNKIYCLWLYYIQYFLAMCWWGESSKACWRGQINSKEIQWNTIHNWICVSIKNAKFLEWIMQELFHRSAENIESIPGTVSFKKLILDVNLMSELRLQSEMFGLYTYQYLWS